MGIVPTHLRSSEHQNSSSLVFSPQHPEKYLIQILESKRDVNELEPISELDTRTRLIHLDTMITHNDEFELPVELKGNLSCESQLK